MFILRIILQIFSKEKILEERRIFNINIINYINNLLHDYISLKFNW